MTMNEKMGSSIMTPILLLSVILTLSANHDQPALKYNETINDFSNCLSLP